MVYIGQSHIVRKENGLFSLRINNYIALVVFFLVFTLIGGKLSPGIVFSTFAHYNLLTFFD